jgi:integrase
MGFEPTTQPWQSCSLGLLLVVGLCGGPRKVLEPLRFYVLRHSFTSLAADLGYSEPAIAALVGHKGRSVTSRYVHSADAVLLAVADAVADRTAKLMGSRRSRWR